MAVVESELVQESVEDSLEVLESEVKGSGVKGSEVKVSRVKW